ncbi:hypothetical protein MMC27_002113 [Xylographa pallens]|nr:hypothetical protein [Xylographa pallens]
MKHDGGIPIDAADNEGFHEIEWLQAKRLELLGRPNWLATPTVKPLKITFTSFEERQMIGRRRKLDENIADRHAKRKRGVGDTDDFVVSHRLSTHRMPLYPKEVASDAVSVRIGTSIHGSQGTRLQPSSRDDLRFHPDGLCKQSDAKCAHMMLSVNEVLKDDANASSSIFEALESSANASLSVIEIPHDRVEYISQSRDQRKQLHRSIPFSTSQSSKGDCKAATVITRRPPGNAQHHIPVSQHQTSAEYIMSSASSHGHARQQNGRLIFPTSPFRPQASDNVNSTASANSIPTSDRSISAQASKDEDSIEFNSSEEEWRGFVDIGFTSDDMPDTCNPSSDILEITTIATNLDPAEKGEWVDLLEDLSSSPSMLDAGYSCSDNTPHGESVQAPNRDDGNQYSDLIVVTIPSMLIRGIGDLPTRPFDESYPIQAGPQMVGTIRPTEPSAAIDQDTLMDQKGRYHQTLKEETQEDPDSVWYRFVFGHEKAADDLSEGEEQKRFRRDSPVDSLVVEASESMSAKQSSTPTTKSLVTALNSSPDPLSLPTSSFPAVGNQAPQPKKPKVIFRKPIRFDGPRPRADVVHIGQNLRSSNPLDLYLGDKWRKSRAVPRRRSEMTWRPQGLEEDEDIEDEEDD